MAQDSPSTSPSNHACEQPSLGVVAACLLGALHPELSADEALQLVQVGYTSRWVLVTVTPMVWCICQSYFCAGHLMMV